MRKSFSQRVAGLRRGLRFMDPGAARQNNSQKGLLPDGRPDLRIHHAKRVRVYPDGSILDNIRACSSKADLEAMREIAEKAAGVPPATKRKWAAALQEAAARISA